MPSYGNYQYLPNCFTSGKRSGKETTKNSDPFRPLGENCKVAKNFSVPFSSPAEFSAGRKHTDVNPNMNPPPPSPPSAEEIYRGSPLPSVLGGFIALTGAVFHTKMSLCARIIDAKKKTN